MKIGQIILEDVNNFNNFHHSFEDEWSSTVPDALLLIGPNGCKTTTFVQKFVPPPESLQG